MTTKDLIKKHEGTKLYLYKDSLGITTIGTGHNIQDNGLSRTACDFILDEDIANAVSELKDVFEHWDEIPDVVQSVMTDMMFNLGSNRFSTFKHMINAVKDGNYKLAAKEAKDSKWCDQVGSRCEDNYNLLMNA